MAQGVGNKTGTLGIGSYSDQTLWAQVYVGPLHFWHWFASGWTWTVHKECWHPQLPRNMGTCSEPVGLRSRWLVSCVFFHPWRLSNCTTVFLGGKFQLFLRNDHQSIGRVSAKFSFLNLTARRVNITFVGLLLRSRCLVGHLITDQPIFCVKLPCLQIGHRLPSSLRTHLGPLGSPWTA